MALRERLNRVDVAVPASAYVILENLYWSKAKIRQNKRSLNKVDTHKRFKGTRKEKHEKLIDIKDSSII